MRTACWLKIENCTKCTTK